MIEIHASTTANHIWYSETCYPFQSVAGYFQYCLRQGKLFANIVVAMDIYLHYLIHIQYMSTFIDVDLHMHTQTHIFIYLHIYGVCLYVY